MTEENALLQAALADPTDHALLLVYSDWLEEQGDDVSTAKATFLRLTARLHALPVEEPEVRQRLQELAARLGPEWLAVVSRLDVENCGEKRKPFPEAWRYLAFQCDRSWDGMQPTDDPTVRFCASCGENVYYCDTVVTARAHARAGHCIAVDLGIVRRKDDVNPCVRAAGLPRAQWLAQEAERVSVDEVSAEREERKRKRAEEENGRPVL